MTYLFILVLNFQMVDQPSVSLTFDDGSTKDYPGYRFEVWNQMLLDQLQQAHLKAIFFVTGERVNSPKGAQLLQSWDARDHKIANHSFSHQSYHSTKVTFELFRQDFLENHQLIHSYKNFIPLFRFPYLKEGDTREKIDQFRACLAEHHYANGAVTIDASDWYVNQRLEQALRKNEDLDLEPYRKFYVEHIFDRALYYEQLAYQLTGRHIHHTLLLHHNLTSALFLGDVLKKFHEAGWQAMDAEQAYQDDIFKRLPDTVPAGESIVWALAKASGNPEFKLRYPAEDSVYEKDKMDQLGL